MGNGVLQGKINPVILVCRNTKRLFYLLLIVFFCCSASERRSSEGTGLELTT